ncbi:hypothetical protein [Nocardia arizonensis]|uniref:hypothetical protein n=1 Tax=Nocardia arizonensis TaxID=1141647 RepID=UPI00194E0C2E|nr:hypothetical protein [Nocardia arizonensis]
MSVSRILKKGILVSRYAEVIVLARDAGEVMEHLTVPDPEREWYQCFTPVDDSVFEGGCNGSVDCYMWVIQFSRLNWRGLLAHLEGLDWPYPHSVQVLIRDEEDKVFGLWMLAKGRLTEIPLAGTERIPNPDSITGGVLVRVDENGRRLGSEDGGDPVGGEVSKAETD